MSYPPFDRNAQTPDDMRSGSRGSLPAGFVPWQRGVTCTVRPELLAPLGHTREYRLNVTVRRRIPAGCPFAEYETIYRRATDLAGLRLASVAACNTAAPLHHWLMTHAWFRQHLGGHDFVSASVTHGLVVAVNRLLPSGEPFPPSAALLTDGGHDQQTFAARHLDGSGRRHVDEIYSEFDLGAAPGAGDDVTVSYCEYCGRPEVELEPYVRRAEHLAAFYCQSWAPAGRATPLPIVMREWTSLETGKRTEPGLVAVHVFLRGEETSGGIG